MRVIEERMGNVRKFLLAHPSFPKIVKGKLINVISVMDISLRYFHITTVTSSHNSQEISKELKQKNNQLQ